MGPTLDPGSFRDPRGRVFHHEGRVFRGLSAEGLQHWQRLAQSSALAELSDAGQLIGTELDPEWTTRRLAAIDPRWVAALRHDTVPFVSYPYEWSFSMLRDAARLHLAVHRRLLEDDLTIKDGSSYNVQWLGARPVFIDVGSIEPLAAGAPWDGYTQFCRLFLYPLLLASYRGLPTRTLLRAHLDGPPPAEVARLFSTRDRLRPGVLTHVQLQSKLDARAGSSSVSLRSELRDSGFTKRVIESTLRKLDKLISGLKADSPTSSWASYASQCPSYDDPQQTAKQTFVEQCLEQTRPELVWDLGANTGTFSAIAARRAPQVIAMEADLASVEQHYLALRDQPSLNGAGRVLPLVVDLADPSPALGWRGRERLTLPQRGRPDLTLSLALLHHLTVTANIPVGESLAWLAELGGLHVIERVGPADRMTRHLLRNKADQETGLEAQPFQAALAGSFEVLDSLTLESSDRTLYFARSRA